MSRDIDETGVVPAGREQPARTDVRATADERGRAAAQRVDASRGEDSIANDERAPIPIAAAAQLACLLEASAPKPGNVSPARRYGDITYEDFLASAAAIGAPLSHAGERPLGQTVRCAIEATARWTRSNTNLGIVLLLAPLARAAMSVRDAGRVSDATDGVSGFSRTLRAAVRDVLAETTVDDACDVYAAIRRAAPGGLGRVDAQDVADDPTMTLVDVMRLAADRDSIAREYATAFELTFGTGVPALEGARRDGLSWNDAVVETFLTLLATTPDTHIVRRGGAALAEQVSTRARSVIASGGVRSDSGRRALGEMDHALRDDRHLANPGTAADLTAAATFVVLLGGGWTAGSHASTAAAAGTAALNADRADR
jgi:triphosphoribosyl-dephospho-CoA synthase